MKVDWDGKGEQDRDWVELQEIHAFRADKMQEFLKMRDDGKEVWWEYCSLVGVCITKW